MQQVWQHAYSEHRGADLPFIAIRRLAFTYIVLQLLLTHHQKHGLCCNVDTFVWHLAGGHGVATNHTLAHEHYLDAHDAGHWRAPHSLAMTHQQGWGVQPNCSKAQHYIQTFIKERSNWSEQMDEAVLALDAGLPPLCFSLLPER